MLDADAGEHGTLITHMARANPHWKQIGPDDEVLVVFQGAHSYISPRWYADSSVVPTWNYATVHASGKPRLIHDEARLKQIVTALVEFHEGPGGLPGLETNFPEHLLKAIVGLEIPIDWLEANRATRLSGASRTSCGRICGASGQSVSCSGQEWLCWHRHISR
jgi:transcriptional regulator